MQFVCPSYLIKITESLRELTFLEGLSGPTHFQGLWDRSWDNYVVDKYSGKATEVLYPVGIFLVKLSLLWFYWGLSTYWPLRVAAAVTAVVALGNSLAMIFIWVFRCSPVLAFAGMSL